MKETNRLSECKIKQIAKEYIENKPRSSRGPRTEKGMIEALQNLNKSRVKPIYKDMLLTTPWNLVKLSEDDGYSQDERDYFESRYENLKSNWHLVTGCPRV